MGNELAATVGTIDQLLAAPADADVGAPVMAADEDGAATRAAVDAPGCAAAAGAVGSALPWARGCKTVTAPAVMAAAMTRTLSASTEGRTERTGGVADVSTAAAPNVA